MKTHSKIVFNIKIWDYYNKRQLVPNGEIGSLSEWSKVYLIHMFNRVGSSVSSQGKGNQSFGCWPRLIRDWCPYEELLGKTAGEVSCLTSAVRCIWERPVSVAHTNIRPSLLWQKSLWHWALCSKAQKTETGLVPSSVFLVKKSYRLS